MGRFWIGLALGLAIGAGLLFVFRPGPQRRSDRGAREAEQRRPPRNRRPADVPAFTRSGVPDARAPFAAGTAVLRIGDGYVFGDGRAHPAAEAASVDLLCLDLPPADVVPVHCAGGVGPALLPVLYPGDVPQPAAAFELVRDAPPRFPGRGYAIPLRATGQQSGVALVRSRAGRVFKVFVTGIEASPNALKRAVHIRYAEVSVAEDGGIVRIPGALTTKPVAADRDAALRERFVPLKGFRDRKVVGLSTMSFVKVPQLPPEFEVRRGGALVLPGLLTGVLTAKEPTALLLRAGTKAGSTIQSRTSLHVVVEGPHAGSIDTRGVIRIRGDLVGHVRTAGVLIVDGDLLGTIEYHGIPYILVRGRVHDPKTAFKGNGIPHIHLEHYITEAELRVFKGMGGIPKVEVRTSDLKKGSHRGIGRWSLVRVGGPLWENLGPRK